MRVLVVDDEAPARARLQQIVEELDGYTCVGVAANGDEALQLAVSKQPDIVLLDIRMPGLSGIEVANHLMSLSLRYHSKRRFGDLLSRISGDVSKAMTIAWTISSVP